MIDRRYYVEAECSREREVWIEAVPPTWRDIPAILRGTYVPQVKRVEHLTVQGISRVLKEVYVEPVREGLLAGQSLFMPHREDDDQ